MKPNLPTYARWEDVPPHLKTKTGLAEQGLRPAPGQSPVALKTSRRYRTPDYALYEIGQAIPKRPATPNQLAALARGRHRGRTCARCGQMVRFKDELYRRLCYDCRIAVVRAQHHTQSILWAKTMLSTMPQAVIIDTETTGLSQADEVIQLAIVSLTGQRHFTALFRPTVLVSSAARAVHRLSDEVLSQALPFVHYYTQVRGQLQGHPIIAYGQDFDQRLLTQTRKRYGLPSLKWGAWHCAMARYAAYYGEIYHLKAGIFRWQKLGEACAQLGLELKDAHEAGADALATVQLIQHMAETALPQRESFAL